mmetsp:Transcript_16623/g.55395  ORF Transcript_16623/g.55395 Transcript_16623/m.55395 type:complete len:657 (-) Transcript_16623:18-1988(-)
MTMGLGHDRSSARRYPLRAECFLLAAHLLQLDMAAAFAEMFSPTILAVNHPAIPHQVCDGCPRIRVASVGTQHCLQDILEPERGTVMCEVEVRLDISRDMSAYPNVSILGSADGRGVEMANCKEHSCRFCSRRLSSGKQHLFRFQMVEASSMRAITSPEILSLVLLPHCHEDGLCDVGITVLPPRIFHGSRQKIPHSCALLMTPDQLSEVEHRAVSCEGRGRMVDRFSRFASESESEFWMQRFHPPTFLDDTGFNQNQQDKHVFVGGLGWIDISWPQNASGTLNKPFFYKVVPISYAAYPEYIRDDPLPKIYDFAPYKPGSNTMYRSHRMYNALDEADYFDDYSRSYFAITRRKAGWDCMRHYEILAAGAIPYFFNLTSLPRQTMMTFPRGLVIEAMGMKGVTVIKDGDHVVETRIDHSVFNHSHYFILLHQLQDFTKKHLSTIALAKRFLKMMNVTDLGAVKVLYIVYPGAWPPDGTFDEGGNLRDMLFHGLRSLLGPSLVDPIRLDHMYDDWFPAQGQMPLQDWELTEKVVRDGLHAWGYFHAGHLPAYEEIDRGDIEERLRAKEFDLVVVGSICHDMVARRDLEGVNVDIPDEFPYWETIKEVYQPNQVALVDGDDWGSVPCARWTCFCSCLRRYGPHGVYFWREMHDEIICG